MFTSEMIQLAHQIKRSSDKTWSESLKSVYALCKQNVELSVLLQGSTLSSSVFGSWGRVNTNNLRLHFLLLSKAYDCFDKGRSIAMFRIANILYSHRSMDYMTFKSCKYVGSSVLAEVEDYFMASASGNPTQRQITVGEENPEYLKVASLPSWSF